MRIVLAVTPCGGPAVVTAPGAGCREPSRSCCGIWRTPGPQVTPPRDTPEAAPVVTGPVPVPAPVDPLAAAPGVEPSAGGEPAAVPMLPGPSARGTSAPTVWVFSSGRLGSNTMAPSQKATRT